MSGPSKGEGKTPAMPIKPDECSEVERYKPTDSEIAAIQRYSAKKAQTKTPRISVQEKSGSSCAISYDHDAVGVAQILLSDAIGCVDPDFREGLINDVLNASRVNGREISETRLNMALAVIKDIKPTDAIEAMLAAQMFAVHTATMAYAQRTIDNQLVEDRAEPCLNRLARTFTTQVEALKRYRSKGEQLVRVERVYVGEGGRAVVGNVSAGGGSPSELGGQIHEANRGGAALTSASSTAVPVALTADKAAVRQSCGAREDPVPLSRRQGRRAKGQQERASTRS